MNTHPTPHPADAPPPIHPLPAGMGFCVVVPGFLSGAECDRMVALGEARGYATANLDYPPSYRDNERQVADDPALARDMGARLQSHLRQAGALSLPDADGGRWSFESVNERFRFCRYRAWQGLRIHQDGVHRRGPRRQSRLTFMVYLSDPGAFEGGDTVFYAGGPGSQAAGRGEPDVVARVRPSRGSLILFDHGLWHAGAEVTRGVKHIMRSDLVYALDTDEAAPAGARPSPDAPFAMGHDGHAWTLCAVGAVGAGLLASGGRDTLVRLWTDRGRAAGVLRGHTQSVLGLAALGAGRGGHGLRLASVSRDRSLRVWSVGAGKGEDAAQPRCDTVAHPHASAILCAHAWQGGVATGAADGSLAWTCPDSGASTAWNKAEAGIDGTGRAWVWALACLPDGTLLSVAEDGCVSAWACSGAPLQARPTRLPWRLQARAPLRSMAVSPDGRRVAAGDLNGEINLWRLQAGGWRPELRWQAHAAAVRCLRFDARGGLLSGSEDGFLRAWRLADPEPPGTAAAPTSTWQHAHGSFVSGVLALADQSVLSCDYDGRIVRHRF